MHNVEQLSAATKVPLAEGDSSEAAGQLKVLSERVDARAAFEAELEAYWATRIRQSVRGYRRCVYGFALLSLLLAGWAGALTVFGKERLEVVGVAALEEVRTVVESVQAGR